MFEINTVNEKFMITRYDGWEEILEPLIRRITGASQGKTRTGANFENEVFKMKTHRFGTCHCLYGKEFRDFEEKQTHSLECFHTQWSDIQEAFKKHPKYHDALILKTERINMEIKLCRDFRIPYKGGVLGDICTCSFKKKWEDKGILHEETCEHVAPNFKHIESGFSVWWNQKFFRDSYSNERIEKKEFSKIIKECLKSI